MQELIQGISTEFVNRFGDGFILVKSPGRVNLIGEHTDYNEGFVLPAAVDKSIILAMRANETDQVRFYAADKEQNFETDISGSIDKSEVGWANYLLGVVDELRNHDYKVEGFDCVFGGNVPIGAGMSSSAALEGGVLFGLTKLFNLEIPPVEMARIAQKAENDFVGVQCGIMDQFVSLNGKENNALKLDCRTLEHEYYPFDHDDIHIVLCDTGVTRELASSEYNVRRSQCEQGVSALQEYDPEITSLRDVSLELLISHEKDLDPLIFKRCKYVVEENERVLLACQDLKNNDLKSFGQRMYQSHSGLRHEYEVSCRELDTLVDIAREIEGVIGCRMMGGGFGGCTINLIEDRYLDTFVAEIQEQYERRLGDRVSIYKTKVSGGTHLLETENVSS